MRGAIAELRSQPAASDDRGPIPPVLTGSTTVLVYAKDPISRAGVASQLSGVPGVQVVAPGQDCRPDVAVVVADAVDHEVLRVVRTVRRAGRTQVVVVARALDPASALAAMDAGAAAFLPVRRADRTRLVDLVVGAHRGEAVVPGPAAGADPVADARREHPSWPPASTAWQLTGRELSVLRLLAEGYDTAEIADRLAYSEPTIKNVIQRLFERLHVRNRPHAVAVALRAGII